MTDDRFQRLIEASRRFDAQARAVQRFSSVIRPELLEQARQMQERMRLIPSLPTIVSLNSDLMAFQRSWRHLSSVVSPNLIELGRRATQLTKGIAPVLENFRRASDTFKPLFEELYRHDAAARRGEAAGWLPHRTMPFDALSEEDLAEEAVIAILQDHYVDGWPDVRAAFEAALDGYAVDDVAKAAFIEALDSHEAGRYRSVVALVFNEIERVVRVELYGGGPGMIGSLPKLQDLAGEVLPSTIEPGGGAGLRLFERLIGHLYAHVKTDDDVARFHADPVPNRHAATHGLIVYDTVQNSLNTLIMADYVFQVITLAKTQDDEDEAA